MKNFARPSFFRLFDLLLSLTNPGMKRSHWMHDVVEFERERYSVTVLKHGFAIEIFTLTRPGSRGWSLMVTKEYWWAGADSKALKNVRWARPISGRRGDILSWLRAQEAKVGNSPSIEDHGLAKRITTPNDGTGNGDDEHLGPTKDDDHASR
jgi:hypothetical protein